MKILCISLNHAPEQTGIGKFQGEMVAALTARGHDIRVVTAPPYYPGWKVFKGFSATRYTRETLSGATIYRVPLYVPSRQGGGKRVLHLLSFALSSMPVILWQAMRWRPDVILTTAPPLFVAPVVYMASLLSGARSHMHVQDFEVDAAFNLGMLKRSWLLGFASAVEKGLLRIFRKVSTISPRMRDRLIAKGVAQDRAFLIPNWGSIDEFDPAKGPGLWRKKLTKHSGTVLALYSGAMGKKQGLKIIIDAARILKANTSILFVLCGDGAEHDEIIASATGLENVLFLSVQPWQDFTHLMIAADIHLLPQRAEAADLVMPSKLGNILASGKPVVASASPNTQIYDAIEGCGIAVEPDNARQFAEAIATLAADPELRETLGAQGRKRARAEWGKDAILDRMESVLAAA